MILSCGETWEAKKRRLTNWHRKFAWLPVTIGEMQGRYKCVWLEFYLRKGRWNDHFYEVLSWEYKEIE